MKHPLPSAFACLCQRIAPAALLLLGLAQPTWAALTVNGDGTVTDGSTRLVWDQCPYGLSGSGCVTGTAFQGNWADALSAAVTANAISYKGFSDWRVPNVKELVSIVKIDSDNPAIDTTAFPGAPKYVFWTSTTQANFPSAWYVAFSHGHTNVDVKSVSAYYVRLVRSGQSFASFDVLGFNPQTISFANPGAQTFGTTPTLSATVSSGRVPAFTSSTPAVCTSTPAGTLTFVTLGTCTIKADQAGNHSYNAAPQITRSFSIDQASQTIIFGAAPSVIVGGTGSVSTTGGASGVGRVYVSTTPGACTVNSSTGVVTGVAAGSNNCTITADQAGNTNYSAAVQASQSFSIGVVPVTPPTPDPTPAIPLLGVSMGGLTGLPQILNMASGVGPSFMDDLVRILSNALGQPLHFIAQNAQGTVTLRGFNGGNLAFVPMNFQTGDSRADGLYPMGYGQYHVVRNGRSLVIAPALVRLDQLTALLPGVAASQADNGVITAQVNGLTYVVQASVPVQLDAASGNAQVTMGSDGFFHFIDAQGNHQVLYPAFAEPVTLSSILLGLDSGVTGSIQLDGTALIVFNGQRYRLVPDLTLAPVPADRVGQRWWQESDTRYRFANVQTQPAGGTSQGFTVKP